MSITTKPTRGQILLEKAAEAAHFERYGKEPEGRLGFVMILFDARNKDQIPTVASPYFFTNVPLIAAFEVAEGIIRDMRDRNISDLIPQDGRVQ
jgi:hypothetical protein